MWRHPEADPPRLDYEKLKADAAASREAASAMASARRVGGSAYPGMVHNIQARYIEKDAATDQGISFERDGRIESSGELVQMKAAGARTARSLKDKELMSLYEQMGATTF